MKLALIGRSLKHSLSPLIYKKILMSDIDYDLIDVDKVGDLPSLATLFDRYQGVSVTSPYKEYYFSHVQIENPSIYQLGAINALGKFQGNFFGTNTDYLMIKEKLIEFKLLYSQLQLIILGSGVMARVSALVARELGIQTQQISRKENSNFNYFDLRIFRQEGYQNIIINACSRDFIFKGQISNDDIFWDFNYNHLPHQNTLIFKVAVYIDGFELLYGQAIKAVNFWNNKFPEKH